MTEEPATSTSVTVAGIPPVGVAAESQLSPGAIVDRYIILSQLGVGGMGIVYAAYDPDLDRKVALKLLKRQYWSEKATTRVLREAQALAKLSHPNVVGVYDVGTDPGALFIAMELVDGITLGEWRKIKEPSLSKIVDVMTSAGQGLAAAHAAGLVHRDVKPSNIMIEPSGRARVLDFGVARPDSCTDEMTPNCDEASKDHPRASALHTPLTQDGMVVGTRPYMAPEQKNGATNARTDQYAFCVTLHEAACGYRPDAKRPPDVPAWLRRVIERGCSEDPHDRYSSMTELLAELSRRGKSRLRRAALITVPMAALIALAVVAVAARASSDNNVCKSAQDKLAGVWDDNVHRAVRTSFIKTGQPHASVTVDRVATQLNAMSKQWVQARAQVCEATHVRKEQSERLLDARMRCLDRQRIELRALTRLFTNQADNKMVDGAVRAVFGLRRPAQCTQIDPLDEATAAPTAKQLPLVTSARERMSEGLAYQRTGRLTKALAMASQILADARTIGYEPLISTAWLHLGELQMRAGKAKQAETSLRQAVETAARAKNDIVLAKAVVRLIYVLGNQLGRHDEAIALGQLGKSLVLRAGNPAELRAHVLIYLGITHTRKGKHDKAVAYVEQGFAVLQGHLPPEHVELGYAQRNLGAIHLHAGNADKAHEQVMQSVRVLEKQLGPRHPVVGGTFNQLGEVEKARGNWAKARNYFERGLDIISTGRHPKHPHQAMIRNNLGELLNRLGEHKRALQLCTKAVDIGEASLPAKHPGHAHHLTCVGLSHIGLGQPDAAIPMLKRALAMRKSARTEAIHMSASMFGLAQALWDSKQDRKRALTLAQQAHRQLAKTGSENDLERRELSAWLAARDRLPSETSRNH